jgi:peptidoglycan/xylan/chitin deacetylase (PgdA/CDA1 family)
MRSSPAKRFLKSFLGPPFRIRFRARSRTRKIALTFDDGPLDSYTDRVIDILQTYGHRATFFVVGERAVRHRKMLELMAERGCEVGNHSYSHPHIARLSCHEIAQEFQRTDDLVQSVVGVRPRYLRPPFGELSAKLALYLARHRTTAVLWSAEFGGFESVRDQDHDALVKEFVDSDIEGGEIILLHDTNANVVQALPGVLANLAARHLESVTLSELFAESE